LEPKDFELLGFPCNIISLLLGEQIKNSPVTPEKAFCKFLERFLWVQQAPEGMNLKFCGQKSMYILSCKFWQHTCQKNIFILAKKQNHVVIHLT
jgi:hypothetical protein